MDVRHQPDHMTGRRDYLDLALINYNLAVDMTDSFHWNVKMIFLYMVAEYTNEDNSVNQVGLERERERERCLFFRREKEKCWSDVCQIFCLTN